MTLYNLARMKTETTGQGPVTLTDAVPSFLSFTEAGAQVGDTVTYAIEEGLQREIGRGLYDGETLTRNVLRSTNSNQPIPLTGDAQVSITAAAEDLQSTHSLATSGYMRFPNGLMIQWGSYGDHPPHITFPVAFPTACFTVVVTPSGMYQGNQIGVSQSLAYAVDSLSQTGATVHARFANEGGSVGVAGQGYYWMAIGR
jgi:hypothetical protein